MTKALAAELLHLSAATSPSRSHSGSTEVLAVRRLGVVHSRSWGHSILDLTGKGSEEIPAHGTKAPFLAYFFFPLF
ncbi:hypothetical protein Taro_013899 [Colocasia esculenta]|uniref:Uncharacterized protein n=1 Tax=Colocasia esculenta TaxID=4460 RepID=A0A843UGT6_COLES|nr:hypothetical protein [Colocasia esculenta]